MNNNSEFRQVFSQDMLCQSVTHGRVNILGEHTDYNHGCVLPMQIQACTIISIALHGSNETGQFFLTSEYSNTDSHVGHPIKRHIDNEKSGHWSDYVIGPLKILLETVQTQKPNFMFPSLDMYITSNIPIGAGLSSSAALEVGVLKSVRNLYTLLESNSALKNTISDDALLPDGFNIHEMWDDLEIAKLSQRAENSYIELPCGLMDQLVISVGNTNSATFIDFADADTPQYESRMLFSDVDFMVIYSGVTHNLTTSGDMGYHTRVAQCQEAVRALAIPHLSVLDLDDLKEIITEKKLDPIIEKRVRHVVEENTRVRNAVASISTEDIDSFAHYMIESHKSQRDLYDVSIPEINALVEDVMHAGALGARLTGGGFGGSIIAMIKKGDGVHIWDKICLKHPQASWLQ